MADESRVLEIVRRYFEFAGADVERAEEIYHGDAVLEFPHQASGSKASPHSQNGAGSIPPTRPGCATASDGSLPAPTWLSSSLRPAMTANRGCRASSCWSSAATRWRASGSM